MNVLKSKLLIACICLVSTQVSAEFWSLNAWLEAQKAPDFDNIQHTRERKRAFFDYLLPKINKQNTEIVRLRHSIARDQLDAIELQTLYRYYRVKPGDKTALLMAVDIVPTSLVLAQAAYESNWGRSRFAKHYHNFFGLWCFTQGCGVVPAKRDVGATHEVAKFRSADRAIAYYMRSLNRNPAYQVFREIRQHKRDKDLPISGLALSEGLVNYAAIGYDYVETLQSIIRYNRLSKYDTL